MFSRSLIKLIPGALAVFCLFSCNKKGDFIDENKTGSGIHYYPIIVNDVYLDTLTGKYLNEKDTTFAPGQKIVFEMDYFSRDEPDSLELWAGTSKGDLQKSLAVPYSPFLRSETKGLDTVLFEYTLPSDLDSLSKWVIQPRVVTKNGLFSVQETTLTIQ